MVDEAMQDNAMPTRAMACAAAEKKNRVAGCRYLPGVVWCARVVTPVFYIVLSLFSCARPCEAMKF
jgi:hypothetical protein